MTRPLRPASPLHLCSPLYDPTLNILTTLLSLSFLLLPIANTQMVLTNKNKNITNEINLNLNYTKVEKYTITPKNEGNELINTVSSKNYQTLIDRFRRKDFVTTENTNVVNNTLDIEEYQIDLELDDDSDKGGLDNNSMEKLRVDDETRTKIFNDFSKTVKINKNQSKIDVVSETNGTRDSVEMKAEVHAKDIKGLSNESLGFPTRFPTSYHVPSITDVQQTPRPSFLDGFTFV
ncbi:hypothetical protein B5X24_HaOG212895 [Helicoverpa armigera]|uniref:Uncharacterized protein n=1 Tax=Helicoverpa armigera TaxID=29058 RepID=A0A2W1BFJ9_HELAM|nr:hypothetical protein B5X24_HaOG212895 [Helicoverpa armigera]